MSPFGLEMLEVMDLRIRSPKGATGIISLLRSVAELEAVLIGGIIAPLSGDE
jgi:hypothetical protein